MTLRIALSGEDVLEEDLSKSPTLGRGKRALIGYDDDDDNKCYVTKFLLKTLFFAVCEHKYFAIVSVTIDLCQRYSARPNAP